MREEHHAEGEAYDEVRPGRIGVQHGVQRGFHVVSSPVVSLRFAIVPVSRRVYTIALGLSLGVVALGIGYRAPAPAAPDRVAVQTQMVKGPAAAPGPIP